MKYINMYILDEGDYIRNNYKSWRSYPDNNPVREWAFSELIPRIASDPTPLSKVDKVPMHFVDSLFIQFI